MKVYVVILDQAREPEAVFLRKEDALQYPLDFMGNTADESQVFEYELQLPTDAAR